MKKILLLFLIAASSVLSFAQNKNYVKGSEKPLYLQNSGNVDCSVYKNYVIKGRQHTESGKSFYRLEVFKRNPSLSYVENCRISAEPVFSYDRKEDLNIVENALWGNLLFVDFNLAPDSQVLAIFNLKTKKKIFEKEHTEWRNQINIKGNRYLYFESWTKRKVLPRDAGMR